MLENDYKILFSILQSERARNELAEKVKASENEKLTFEARLAEVAEVCNSIFRAVSHLLLNTHGRKGLQKGLTERTYRKSLQLLNRILKLVLSRLQTKKSRL